MSKVSDIFGASPKTVLNKPFAQFQQVAEAQTYTAGETLVPLNTTIFNNISGASLASNIITLPAGDYHIEVSGALRPAANAEDARLNVAVGGTSVLYGVATSERDTVTTSTSTMLVTTSGRLSLGASSSITILAELSATSPGATLCSLTNPVFTDVRIWKLDESI